MKNLCPFCKISEFVLSNELSFAIFDAFPVTKGHMLVIPRRHFANYFECTIEERNSLFDLVNKCHEYLEENNPDGFNIGININPVAGQTVMHLHIHLIPRFKGDMKDPRGGVRGVIPDKRIYPS